MVGAKAAFRLKIQYETAHLAWNNWVQDAIVVLTKMKTKLLSSCILKRRIFKGCYHIKPWIKLIELDTADDGRMDKI